ncbi:hypothetical protein G6F63_015748 [Rhizopus arrhizus]|nr:hypothetical protein G6F63_015748 [Rhizopus arrhizus]
MPKVTTNASITVAMLFPRVGYRLLVVGVHRENFQQVVEILGPIDRLQVMQQARVPRYHRRDVARHVGVLYQPRAAALPGLEPEVD